MAAVRVLFYLPLADNDGRDLGAEIDAVRKELWVRFSAYTFEGRVEGTYLMAVREAIEKQIEALVAAEVMTAQALSNALFGPTGLFGKLAKTEQERRAVTETPLYRRAQARITALQQFERAEYLQALERTCKARSTGATTNGPAAPANGAPTEAPTRSDATS